MKAHRRPKRAPRKMQLRELSVVKAKPRAQAYLIWDTKEHGLALRVQPSGTKSWTVIYSRRGRPRWLHLGSADVIGLADARLKAKKTMLAVAEGKDPAAEKRAERSKGTFEELHKRYVDEYAKKQNKSWAQADKLVKRYALPRFGQLQAADVSRADVEGMMARLAPVLANQALAAVGAVFSWGIKKDVLAINPCGKVDRNPTRARERVLFDSELPVFWRALDDIKPVPAAVLRMILLTGQRPGEVAHMRREHIVDGWWELPGEPVPGLQWPGTKNGASHRVWLPTPAQAIIAEMLDGRTSGFVFAGARGQPVQTATAIAMRAVSDKLGGEPVRPHDLRRTHGTTITGLKFGRDAMNRIQNHRDGGIASVYDRHQYAEENKRIMESVAAHILALAEGRAGGNVITFGR